MDPFPGMFMVRVTILPLSPGTSKQHYLRLAFWVAPLTYAFTPTWVCLKGSRKNGRFPLGFHVYINRKGVPPPQKRKQHAPIQRGPFFSYRSSPWMGVWFLLRLVGCPFSCGGVKGTPKGMPHHLAGHAREWFGLGVQGPHPTLTDA